LIFTSADMVGGHLVVSFTVRPWSLSSRLLKLTLLLLWTKDTTQLVPSKESILYKATLNETKFKSSHDVI